MVEGRRRELLDDETSRVHLRRDQAPTDPRFRRCRPGRRGRHLGRRRPSPHLLGLRRHLVGDLLVARVPLLGLDLPVAARVEVRLRPAQLAAQVAPDGPARPRLAGQPDVAVLGGQVARRHGLGQRVADVGVLGDDLPGDVDVGRARQRDLVGGIGQHDDDLDLLVRLEASQDPRHGGHAGDVGDQQLPAHAGRSGVQAMGLDQPDPVARLGTCAPSRIRGPRRAARCRGRSGVTVDDAVVRDV